MALKESENPKRAEKKERKACHVVQLQVVE